MRRRPLTGIFAALLTVALLPVSSHAAPKGAQLLDKAASCKRSGNSACVATNAELALKWLATDAGTKLANRLALRREALTFRAEALALLDDPRAAAAFDTLLAEASDYAPKAAQPAVETAFRAALVRKMKARLPTSIALPVPPIPPRPSVKEALPEPPIYAPQRLLDLDPQADTQKLFRLSLGVGGALLAGTSSDRFGHGLAAVLELAFKPDPGWRILLQASISLHNISDGIRVEEGYGGGLTAVAIVLGGGYDLNVYENLDLTFGLAIGGGFFGVKEATDEVGFAGQAIVGIRYWVSESLALRVDATPTMFLPIGGVVSVAAHVSLFARAEAKF